MLLGSISAIIIPLLTGKELQEVSRDLAVIIVVSFLFIQWIAAVLRMKNIGHNKWWGTLILIPLVNCFVFIYCLIAPEGYADRETESNSIVDRPEWPK